MQSTDPQIKERRMSMKMEVNKRVGQIAASAAKTMEVVRAAPALQAQRHCAMLNPFCYAETPRRDGGGGDRPGNWTR